VIVNVLNIVKKFEGSAILLSLLRVTAVSPLWLFIRQRTQTALFIFVLIFSFGQASAQTPTITWIRDLSFGTISTAGTTTIAYNNAAASEFVIQFPAYSQSPNAAITFILPTYLTDSYGDHLPISFGATSGAYHVGTNSTNGATTFDPDNGVNGTVSAAAHSDYFWIGGILTVGAGYSAAVYTGIITATVTVTVNGQQYTANQTINITATLQGTISLSATGALGFGTIVAGTTPASLSAQTNPSAPLFTVTAPRRSRITVTFSTTSLTGNGNPLTFTPSVYGSTTSTNQSGSTAVTSGSSVTLGGTNTHYYYWLGGALGAVPSGQAPGSYSGTFVLRVSY